MITREGAAQIGLYLYRGTGAALAIALMEVIAGYADEPLSRVPFVTSIVLVLTLPHSEASRPYCVVVGHMCSSLAGLAALLLLGQGTSASAVGVGLAGFLMLALRAPHPPAGIDAFLIALNGLSLRWILSPVLAGCILLVLYAQLWRWGERTMFRSP
jgi:CBS-domain-containing membrane protein